MSDITSMEVNNVSDLKDRIGRAAGQILEQMSIAYNSLEQLVDAGFITGSIKEGIEAG